MRAAPLIALLVASPAWAGAWTRDAGSFYAKLGADAYISNNYVATDRPAEETVGSYFGRQLVLYGEVGVLKSWPLQVTASVPLTAGTLAQDGISIPLRGPRATSVRLGDLRLAAQTALTKDLPLAAALEVKIPLYQNGNIGKRYGQSYQELFPIPGDGQIDVAAWFLAGASIKDTPLWNDFGAGYLHRTEVFVGWDVDARLVDGIVFYDTVGATFGPVVPMIRVDGVKNLAPSSVTKERIGFGPAVLVDVAEGVAIEARSSFDVWARNTAPGVGFGLGVSVRR